MERKYHLLRDVKLRIDKNYACIKELEKSIILQKTDEEKLELISVIGKMYAEYITGIYSSCFLEQQIIEIGKKIDYIPLKVPLKKGNKRHILIVMSSCAATGGHTVLVHNWIKWDIENSYSIVFTKMDECQTPDFIRSIVQESGGNITYLSGFYMEKALKLLELSEKFQKIILFTHMEDIVPVLAYSNQYWRVPVYFYNHADFKFSYGFSVSDMILNLNEFDVDKTIRFRGINEKESIYLQFPGYGQMDKKGKNLDRLHIRAIIEEKYQLEKNEKLIVSMGYDFKYKNIIGYKFDTYVETVLYQYGGKCSFLIIGADKDSDKWIQLNIKTRGKARALGILPRDEAEYLISAADIFIVSFPMAASGQQNAEQVGVPWLRLNIYGRGVRAGDTRYAESVEELIAKTLDILNGNEKKYLSVRNTDIWTKQEWKEKWKEVCNSITYHKIHSFSPQRHLEKQEYVNCQLMQAEAAKEVFNYLTTCDINSELKKELFRLDQKYHMGITYKYAFYLEERYKDLKSLFESRSLLSDKHLQLYLTSIKWIEVKQKGKRIDEYLWKKGYQTIAIYGMGYMGRCILNEFSGDYVKVQYGIDRNAEQLHSEVKIFTPMEHLQKVDLIINTTRVDNSEILETMHTDGVKMIRIDELLNELSKD